jgi:hypothetical protein
MTEISEGPPRWGDADGPEGVCFTEQHPDKAPTEKNQAEILPFPRRTRPPRPRRLEVQIAVRDGPMPVGRSRPFQIQESDLPTVVEVLERLEQGA